MDSAAGSSSSPSKEKQIKEHINWNRQFNLIRIDKLCEKFSTKYDLSYIKIFNINSMYWLKSYDLLDCISEMKNLHTLLALDTQLDLFESHCEVYKKLPLKKVALTVDLTRKINYQKSVHYACPQVEELCFKYLISRDTIMKPFCPFRYLHPSILKYQKIKELVLMDAPEDDHARVLEVHVYKQCTDEEYLSLLQDFFLCERLTIKSARDLSPLYRLLKTIGEKRGFRIVYNNDIDNIFIRSQTWNFICGNHKVEKFDHFNEMICYKTEEMSFEQFLNTLDLKLENRELQKLRYFPRVGNEFGELFIPHLNGYGLLTRFSKICEVIPNLRKLTINTCLLLAIDRVKDDLPDLYELEIIEHSDCDTSINDKYKIPYEVIGKFKNLRKLSIEGAPGLGNALEVILKNCQRLKSLRIIAFFDDTRYIWWVPGSFQIRVDRAIMNNLKYAKKLKEFSLYTKKVLIGPLIQSFDTMKAKLERIYVQAKHISYDPAPFKHFIAKNPQLLVFINEVTDEREFERLFNIKGMISYENAFHYSYFNGQCISNKKDLRKDINIPHSDLIYRQSYSGFDPFADF